MNSSNREHFVSEAEGAAKLREFRLQMRIDELNVRLHDVEVERQKFHDESQSLRKEAGEMKEKVLRLEGSHGELVREKGSSWRHLRRTSCSCIAENIIAYCTLQFLRLQTK